MIPQMIPATGIKRAIVTGISQESLLIISNMVSFPYEVEGRYLMWPVTLFDSGSSRFWKNATFLIV
jgi:hypothetical protein